MTPTIKNRAPVEMPWLIIWRTAPLAAIGVRTNKPSMTKPMWETDE